MSCIRLLLTGLLFEYNRTTDEAEYSVVVHGPASSVNVSLKMTESPILTRRLFLYINPPLGSSNVIGSVTMYLFIKCDTASPYIYGATCLIESQYMSLIFLDHAFMGTCQQ